MVVVRSSSVRSPESSPRDIRSGAAPTVSAERGGLRLSLDTSPWLTTSISATV